MGALLLCAGLGCESRKQVEPLAALRKGLDVSMSHSTQSEGDKEQFRITDPMPVILVPLHVI